MWNIRKNICADRVFCFDDFVESKRTHVVITNRTYKWNVFVWQLEFYRTLYVVTLILFLLFYFGIFFVFFDFALVCIHVFHLIFFDACVLDCSFYSLICDCEMDILFISQKFCWWTQNKSEKNRIALLLYVQHELYDICSSKH